MKKFEINQVIKLPTSIKGKYKRVHYPDKDDLQDQVDLNEFKIIGKNNSYSEYLVLLDSNMLGYDISDFHIIHSDVDSKYKGCKFWYVAYQTLVDYN